MTKLDFDPQAAQLHVSGRVAEENKHVKLGGFHTLDLELHRNFTLEKAEGWDSVALDTLKESVNVEAKAQLWAVVMQEGIAHICLVTDHQTILRQKVDVSLPKKRPGSSEHEKSMQRFFRTTFDSLLRQIDITNPKPILLASPGYTAGLFLQYIKAQAANGTDKRLRELVPKLIVAHSASGHLFALAEVLASPAVTSKLSDTKFARETQLMDRFTELIRKDDQRAWYGSREVEYAVMQGAVGKGGGVLLISNALFRSQSIETRKRWVAVVDEVKSMGGEVRVCSSLHESGRRLEALGGIAAILTYPIEDLDEGINGGEDTDVTTDGPDDVEGRADPNEDIDFF